MQDLAACLRQRADVPTEHEEQVAFIQWFRRRHPNTMIFAIPNGGGRSKAEGGRLKLEGVTKGVPDLFIPSAMLFIEMKRRKGGVRSPEQIAVAAYLRDAGYRVVFCAGCDEAIAACTP